MWLLNVWMCSFSVAYFLLSQTEPLVLWLLIKEGRLSLDSSSTTFQEFRWFVCIPGLSCQVQGSEEFLSDSNKTLCDSKADRLHFDAYRQHVMTSASPLGSVCGGTQVTSPSGNERPCVVYTRRNTDTIIEFPEASTCFYRSISGLLYRTRWIGNMRNEKSNNCKKNIQRY